MKFVPLSRERHAGQGWRNPTDYSFAANQAVASIVAQEVATAASKLPLAFIKMENIYQLVALLALERGRNLFVGSDGQWLAGTYVPATFRAHPFRLMRFEGESRMALCIDEDSGLIGNENGHQPFFDEGGTPSKPVSERLKFLEAFERSRHKTELAVSALAETRVIRPWRLKVRAGEIEGQAKGLYHIDETALNGLDTDSFIKLRKVGALPIVYAQLLSSGMVEIFPRLQELHARHAARGTAEFSLSGVSFDHLS